MNLKSFLKFEIDYVDGELIELQINGSNCYYKGETNVYVTDSSLINFSNQLIDFPKYEKNIFYEFGEKNSKFSYFSISFYPADSLSHIGVQVIMETEVGFREKDKCKTQFEILVEPNAIDEFIKAITQIANKKSGFAILYGSDNRL